MRPLVKMSGITVQFGGVSILRHANLEVQAGEIHALLGENGAGKSSLMKVLAGDYPKTAGTIEIDGERVEYNTPHGAIAHGISMIHQELQLAPHLTVAENVFLGREVPSGRLGWLPNKREMRQRTAAFLRDLAPDIGPDERVGQLGIAKQQMVAIVKALSAGARVLIMDESTTALTDAEVKRLFQALNDLKARGVAVIFITHRLEEVLEMADRATVMRDGETVATVPVKDVDMDRLIQLMVGRQVHDVFPKAKTTRGAEGLRVEHLTRHGVLDDISFTAYRGEVLGLAGLMGAGRTELMRAIFGADPMDGGQVYVNGNRVSIRHCGDAISAGIAYLTEDRKGNGLAVGLDVTTNLTLPVLHRIARFGVPNLGKAEQITRQYVDELSIKVHRLTDRVNILSGGNQQKIMLAKWLATGAEVYLLDEPTRGIDVQTKVEVYELINQLTAAGKTVIMTSSYLPELLAMSDRFIVLCEGRVTAELSREEATPEKLIYHASQYRATQTTGR
ncbi:sugar ABC transporter ATP-binding protein [Alicyclobacillus macrosporangiidus]|jgi:ribose transport system ATP-binding protein|uniref:Ribose transport system ATP-binding protein n=1 Tax=Alicyclobacillus macrosporangiidus TaxID=392015 RepID=A0A1I7JHT4_9BACL|nr:sugar ABC transporter ATP-binding protein [Alicyclobacillus macrosporangiidus]SFU84718.1 ribose transport system ATP-binding protein [Alicyclobacillus macrosporangiidus]